MLPQMRIYEDELVSSGLIRCCRAFRLPFKQLARDVLGTPGLRPIFFSAYGLEAVAPLFGTSPDQLLWDHTPFPYATAFTSRKAYESARDAALGRTAMAPLLVVLQNATGTVHFRRVCPQCVREDFEQYGESYWHRVHNLPGVLTCVRHGCALSSTPIAATGELRTFYELPHECKNSGIGLPASAGALARIASQSAQLLRRQRLQGEPRAAHWYRNLAVTHGWLSAQREVDPGRLATLVSSAYPKRYLRMLGFANMRWASQAFRRENSPSPLSPLKHLILEGALTAQAPVTVSRAPLDFVSSGPPGTDAAELDNFYSPRAEAELRRAIRSGERLTTETFLSRVAANGVYRHRKQELPKLRKVVLEFRASQASVKPLRPGKQLFRKQPSERIPPAAPS